MYPPRRAPLQPGGNAWRCPFSCRHACYTFRRAVLFFPLNPSQPGTRIPMSTTRKNCIMPEARLRSGSPPLVVAFSLLAAGAPAQAATTITFDVPGATYTEPAAINDSGTITGMFTASGPRGFMRTADGTFTTFRVKGESATYPMGINRHGVITVYYVDHQMVGNGFVRSKHGKLT